MKVPFVDLKKQYLSIKKEIDSVISEVINETAFVKGKYVKKFEEDFSKSYGIGHTISCGNGTDAIYIALRSLDIGPGDEVITSSMSWISTSEVISQTGAKPVFIDVGDDYLINSDLIERKINEKTKAIIPVHLYGQPSDMNKVMQIAEKYNLKVIEDCAQAHFSKFKGKNVGTFGDFGTFSFYPGKNLGAYGDAGALITDDKELALKAEMFCNHGSLKKHEHKIEGINSRMDGIQAAILSVKLNFIHDWTQKRNLVASYYNKHLSTLHDKLNCPIQNPDIEHSFHLFVVKTSPYHRDNLKKWLESKGISTGIHYPKALPFLDAYNYLGHDKKEFPNAFNFQESILSLPIYPELTEPTVEAICKEITQYFDENFN